MTGAQIGAQIGDNEIADLVQQVKDEWNAAQAYDVEAKGKRDEASSLWEEARKLDEKSDALDEEAQEIEQRSYSRRVTIGHHLIALKALVNHGEWTPFIAANFPELSLRDCQRCMSFAGAPDPEQAEQEAKDAEAERQRVARAGAAEARRIAERADAEKRQTPAPSVAFDALAGIESARPKPSAALWDFSSLPSQVPINAAGEAVGEQAAVVPVKTDGSSVAQIIRSDDKIDAAVEQMQEAVLEIDAYISARLEPIKSITMKLRDDELDKVISLLEPHERYLLRFPVKLLDLAAE
jgi:hypothetical protein